MTATPPPGSAARGEHRRILTAAMKLQAKLWIEAARDLLLSPVTLLAAALDFLLAGRQQPRYFRQTLEFGRRSDEWIDLWGRREGEVTPGSVDSVLENVEAVLRDPQVGARRARVLKRWAERQLSRARRRIEPPQQG